MLVFYFQKKKHFCCIFSNYISENSNGQHVRLVKRKYDKQVLTKLLLTYSKTKICLRCYITKISFLYLFKCMI